MNAAHQMAYVLIRPKHPAVFETPAYTD